MPTEREVERFMSGDGEGAGGCGDGYGTGHSGCSCGCEGSEVGGRGVRMGRREGQLGGMGGERQPKPLPRHRSIRRTPLGGGSHRPPQPCRTTNQPTNQPTSQPTNQPTNPWKARKIKYLGYPPFGETPHKQSRTMRHGPIMAKGLCE